MWNRSRFSPIQARSYISFFNILMTGAMVALPVRMQNSNHHFCCQFSPYSTFMLLTLPSSTSYFHFRGSISDQYPPTLPPTLSVPAVSSYLSYCQGQPYCDLAQIDQLESDLKFNSWNPSSATEYGRLSLAQACI